MPFITPEERDVLDYMIDELSQKIETQGQRTYAVYRLALNQHFAYGYTSMSTARAILKDCYDVLTERLLAYEREKEAENGGI